MRAFFMKKTKVQNRRLSPRTGKTTTPTTTTRKREEYVFTKSIHATKLGKEDEDLSRCLLARLCLRLLLLKVLRRGGKGVGKSSSSRRWDDDDDGKEIRRGKRFGTFASKGAGFERTTTRKPTQTTTGRGEDKIDDSETKTKREVLFRVRGRVGKKPIVVGVIQHQW